MQKRRGPIPSALLAKVVPPLLPSPSPLPAPFPSGRFPFFPRLWQRTHKKEYVTNADNSRFWLFRHRPGHPLLPSPRRTGRRARGMRERGRGGREGRNFSPFLLFPFSPFFFFIGRILGQRRFPGGFEYGLIEPPGFVCSSSRSLRFPCRIP